jgi:D-inositol-3-phosphate glycosyltransferase
MKNIAMISYHTCPLASAEGKETGGMNVYVLELSRKLVTLGVSVDIFTRSQGADNARIVHVVPGLRVIHLVAGPEESVSKKNLLPFTGGFVKQFQDFCQKESLTYDLLHCHYYLSGLIGREIRKLNPGTPLIMSFHTLALMKNLVARNDAEKEDTGRIYAEMELVAEADAVIALSEGDRQYLKYFYNAPEAKIYIIPPGVDTDMFCPIDRNTAKEHIRVTRDGKIILFVGRIEPLKGIDVLLYAIKIVKMRNPDMPICLCIVGGDISQPSLSWSKTLKELDALRKILNIETTVNFVGQQKQSELPYYYNAADAVVMPSHYESFGIAALEAMSCGVPVITTNVAGISSLIDKEHSSLVTSVNNPLLLASQIEHLLRHPEKREEMGMAIRNKISDLTWDNIARKVSAVYDTAVAGGIV